MCKVLAACKLKGLQCPYIEVNNGIGLVSNKMASISVQTPISPRWKLLQWLFMKYIIFRVWMKMDSISSFALVSVVVGLTTSFNIFSCSFRHHYDDLFLHHYPFWTTSVLIILAMYLLLQQHRRLSYDVYLIIFFRLPRSFRFPPSILLRQTQIQAARPLLPLAGQVLPILVERVISGRWRIRSIRSIDREWTPHKLPGHRLVGLSQWVQQLVPLEPWWSWTSSSCR